MYDTFPVHIQTWKMSDGLKKDVYFPNVVGMENKPLQMLINREKVEANLEEGVLKINLPKVTPDENGKATKIKINKL